jgi:hypothetical protein
VPAAVVLAAIGALVLLGIAEACRLLVQHRVERVLDCATDERFQVVLEAGFVDLPCAPLSGICEREYTLPPEKRRNSADFASYLIFLNDFAVFFSKNLLFSKDRL